MLRFLWIGAKVGGAYVAGDRIGGWLATKIPHAYDTPPPAWAQAARVGTKVTVGVATYALVTMVVG
jgi:hypothetical protein